MGRSKPSAVDDDDLASDFLQLKQEVAAQQSELVDLRKDVQRSNTTQDALVGAVDTHQVLAGVGTQMTALTDAFKSLHVQIPGTPGPSSRPPPNTEGISKPPSPLKIPNSEERQKSLELEDLKRQLEMEKEFTRRCEAFVQNQYAYRGPPGFGQNTSHPNPVGHQYAHTEGYSPPYRGNTFQRNPWHNYARDYE